MMDIKTYICRSMPGLKLAISADETVSFFQGTFETDNKSVQEKIEGHKWYKVFVFDGVVPGKVTGVSPPETTGAAPSPTQKPPEPLVQRGSARGRPPVEEIQQIAANSINAASEALKKVEETKKFEKTNPTLTIRKAAEADRTVPSKTVVSRCPVRQLEDIAMEWEIDLDVAGSMKEKRDIVRGFFEERWK